MNIAPIEIWVQICVSILSNTNYKNPQIPRSFTPKQTSQKPISSIQIQMLKIISSKSVQPTRKLFRKSLLIGAILWKIKQQWIKKCAKAIRYWLFYSLSYAKLHKQKLRPGELPDDKKVKKDPDKCLLIKSNINEWRPIQY